MCIETLIAIVVQVLLELARNRNKNPLPKSISTHGIPLPPERHTLISPNYQHAISRKRSHQAVEEAEEEEEEEEAVDPTPNPPPPQEQRQDTLSHGGTPHRVSFPVGPKRSK